ncbi:hypothetical protein CMO90_04065 [Candidatus Woesearchaeota archaeon]|jgi:hypothetical protein|nr:hypothetical protein [Candidatus Woesearchaeota archaeon]|tara:strand:+ start:149 stop:883 length:735 start_codon:yes stop_codon:yes gene_type:complete
MKKEQKEKKEDKLKKKESGEKAKTVFRKDVLKEVDYLLSKSWITEEEVYNMVKKFLKNYLKLDYEFTKEELFQELKGIYLPYTVRADFFKFIDNIFLFEYSTVKYSDEELRSLLGQFRGYIDYLLKPSIVEKSTAGIILLKRFKRKIINYLESVSKQKQKTIIVEKEEVEKQPTELQISDSRVDMSSLIEKIYFSIDNKDFESAKLLYKKAMNKYHFLTADEKISYYEKLLSVYNNLEEHFLEV